MKKVLFMSAALLVVSVGAAQAATNPLDQGYTRPIPLGSYEAGSNVAIVGCFAKGGGEATVPAGTPFTIDAGWGAATIGQVDDWLHGSTNTLTIGGGSPIDLSPYFMGLTHEWIPDGNWYDVFFYQLPALERGHSVELAYFTAQDHPMVDGVTGFPGPPIPAGGFTYTCTVTGV